MLTQTTDNITYSFKLFFFTFLRYLQTLFIYFYIEAMNYEEARSKITGYRKFENFRCGNCNGKGSVSYGMWAHIIHIEDYQTLIDRGWARAGKFLYKPVLHETCCPLYSIRCDAVELSLTKSQKKVLKRMNRFLNDGYLKSRPVQSEALNEHRDSKEDLSGVNMEINKVSFAEPAKQSASYVTLKNFEESSDAQTVESNYLSKQVAVKRGLGADPKKPPCKKSGLIKKEKRQNKIANTIKKQPNHECKSLEQYFGESTPNCKHKLTIKLVQPDADDPDSEWERYKDVEYALYRKYQTIVHHEPPQKNNMADFIWSIVDTPLQGTRFDKSDDGPGYGTFHQQYWLEGSLIAVGVIDILQTCVISIYFFYDPDFRELSLGTYGSMRELQLTRQLCLKLPTIKYYYLGYYNNFSSKTQYKGKLIPSQLLCPETYEWFRIEMCLIKLEEKKYARFNDEDKAIDSNVCTPQDIDNIRIYRNSRFTTYKHYKRFYDNQNILEDFGLLIGRKCIDTLLFAER